VNPMKVAIVAADAFRNRCDRFFSTPALSEHLINITRGVISDSWQKNRSETLSLLILCLSLDEAAAI